MNVQAITLRNFMSHRDTEVALPPRGLVVVSGSNGSGKSSLVEAVAVAFWGKTLRGTDPWREGEPGSVEVRTDVVAAGRSVTASKRKLLDWTTDVAKTPELQAGKFDTQAKAQDALERVVGELDVWRRTHVFSSQDAAHFTLATDGERKRLLETILGLERFDGAHESARADLRAAEQRDGAIAHDLAIAQVRLADAQRSLAHLGTEADPEPPQPTRPPTDEVATLEERRAALRAAFRSTSSEVERVRREQLRNETDASRAHARLEATQAALRSAQEGFCAACGGPLPTDEPTLQGLEADVQRALAAYEELFARGKALAAEHARLMAQANTQATESEAHEARSRTLLLTAQAHATWAGQHASWRLREQGRQRQRAESEATVAKLSARVAELTRHREVATQELVTLRAVVGVLGLKGVRAHVLGQALTGIEAVANAWLARVAQQPMALHLRPCTETKSGTTSDAISLEVEGAGGGRGYRASSGGERRRIDAALLLALAEVSAAAYGRPPGTVFLDEVFDALDASGVDAVSDALAELAQDRAVVLVTHADALAARVPAALRLHVADGTVHVR